MRRLATGSLLILSITACADDGPATADTDSGSSSDATDAADATASSPSTTSEPTGSTTGDATESTQETGALDSSSTASDSFDPTTSTSSVDTDDESTSSETSSETTGGEPPPDAVIVGCNTAADYEATSYRAEGPVDTPVYAVGIYTDGGFTDPADYDVQWDLPGEGILVLTGYSEAVWNVTVSEGASLSSILVLAGEAASVELTGSDATVEIIEGFTDTAHAYPSLPGASLLAFVEDHLGEQLDGFDGCYEAEGAYIGPSSTDQGPLPPPVEEPAACTAIRDEAAYCLAFGNDYRYTLFGLESGDACTIADGEEWRPTHDSMLGVASDGEIIVCDSLEPNYYSSEATVAGIDLATGEVRWTDTHCGRVTRVGSGIGITAMKDSTLSVFDDYAAAQAGTPAYTVPNIAAGRLVEHEGVLFAGSSVLQRYQLPSGAALGPITLEGSPFVRGISAALDSIVVFDSDVDSLLRYDLDDGSLLETIPLDVDIFFGGVDAMVCFDNP